MGKKTFLTIFVFLLFSTNAFAVGHQELFDKYFKLDRNDQGELIKIKANFINSKFSLGPFIRQLIEDLKSEKRKMSQKGDYKGQVRDTLFSENMQMGLISENNKKTRDIEEKLNDAYKALDEVDKIDVDKFFKQSKLKEKVKEFENKFSEYLRVLDITTIANLENSKYFYQTAVNYQALTWGLKYARKKWANIPVLNVVSFILKNVESMFKSQRNYNQNLLMHLVQTYPAEDFKLTAQEVDIILSSIYESKLTWISFNESKVIQRNWDTYGINKFYRELRLANTGLRNVRGNYDEIGDRINFAFQNATINGEKVLINLFDREHMFSSMPAVAYYYDKPKKILRKRQLIQAIQVGVSLLPLRKFFKTNIDNFFTSMYQSQALREGAIYAYLEIADLPKLKKSIIKQSRNPFLIYIKE